MQSDDQATKFIAELNLDTVGSNLFIGHIKRVPFKMEMVANNQTIGLLFQVRFLKLRKDIPEFPEIIPGGVLERLVAEKKAEFTADNDRAWFNLFAAHEMINDGTLMATLNEFAASIKEYVDFDDQPCFLCKTAKAAQPVYHSEKLHLLCDPCHETVQQKAKMVESVDPANLFLGLLWASIAAIPAGLIWCVGWIVFDRIFAGAKLYTFIFVAAYCAVGAAVGLPICLIIKKIPRRGVRMGKALTIFGCILSALTGEAFFCAYIFFRATGEIPNFSGILKAWLIVAETANFFYMIGKIVTLVILCVVCLELAPPNTSIEPYLKKPA